MWEVWEKMWRWADVREAFEKNQKDVKEDRKKHEQVRQDVSWEKLWRWAGEKIRRCEDEKVWRGEGETRPHYWKNPALRHYWENRVGFFRSDNPDEDANEGTWEKKFYPVWGLNTVVLIRALAMPRVKMLTSNWHPFCQHQKTKLVISFFFAFFHMTSIDKDFLAP